MFTILSTCRGGGYRYARTDPLHPKANAKGLYPLHRVLVESRLGRLLDRDEVVHHIDGDGANDDPANLMVLARADHSRLHRPPLEPVRLLCPCGSAFYVAPRVKRARLRQNGGRPLTCSHSCGARYARNNTMAHSEDREHLAAVA